jgi:hypothetical protein
VAQVALAVAVAVPGVWLPLRQWQSHRAHYRLSLLVQAVQVARLTVTGAMVAHHRSGLSLLRQVVAVVVGTIRRKSPAIMAVLVVALAATELLVVLLVRRA